MKQGRIIDKVREIALFEDLFRVILNQNKATYPNMESDWLQALQFYLHGYAYERQGRSPEYSNAAVEAVELAVQTGSGKLDSEFPLRTWSAFLEILRLPTSEGANPKMNPLYPYESTGKTSVTQLVLNLDDYDYNLVQTVLSLLKKGSVKLAHTFLCQIRGTGNKINSLFLRDIVLMYELPIDQRHLLLQPIDVWIRRMFRLLIGLSADVPKGVRDAYSDDIKIAELIVDLAVKAGVSPLIVNQGAWFFGAQIMRTKYRLTQYVEGKLSPSQAIKQAILSLEEQIKAFQALASKL